MLDTPEVIQLPAQHTAIIRLKVPRAQLNTLVPPAIEELLMALGERGVEPAGPLVMHHVSMPAGVFDIELGFPVAEPFEAVGRVEAGQLPETRALKAVHQGSYERLHDSWVELNQWMAEHPELKPAPHLWESYAVGPESGLDTEQWRTDLIQPLAD